MAILNHCNKCNSFVSRKHSECPGCKSSLKNPKKFKVNIPLPDGKRIVRIVDTKYTDARDLEARIRNDLKQEKWFDKKSAPLLTDMVEKMTEYNKRRLKEPMRFEKRWNKHVKPHIPKKMTMDQLTTRHVEKILSKMHDQGLKPATIQHVLRVIGRLYNWAKHQGYYLGDNPTQGIDTIKVHNEVNNYLSLEQVKKLKKFLNKWPDKRGALFIKFAFYTGCRKGEIIDLEWTHVNIESRKIYLADPKGKPVTLPISKKAAGVLRRIKKMPPKVKSKYIFCSRSGKKRIHFKNWYLIKKKAKLPEYFRFHDIRHSYASHQASSGKISIFQLQKLLNHQDIKTTMRYAHLFPSELEKAAENIDSIY
jgi:integrase